LYSDYFLEDVETQGPRRSHGPKRVEVITAGKSVYLLIYNPYGLLVVYGKCWSSITSLVRRAEIQNCQDDQKSKPHTAIESYMDDTV
jgi:hypothetical protein